MRDNGPMLSTVRADVAAIAIAAVCFAGCGNVVVEGSTTEGSAGTISGTGAGGAGGAGGGGAAGAPGCGEVPDADFDGDGFSPAQGDCDDCDANVSPAAAEVLNGDPDDPGTAPLDDDCDGEIDEPPPTCDHDITDVGSNDPTDAARALDVCQHVSSGASFGLISASWMLPDGSGPPGDKLEPFHLGHGILPDLGPDALPRVGGRLVALSTGLARAATTPGFNSALDKGYSSAHPPGMPFESAFCPGVVTGQPHDGIALRLRLRPPPNAVGISYHIRLYTAAWPKDVCSKYNDQAAVLLLPSPATPAGNILVDQLGNPLTVNYLQPGACSCTSGCPPGSDCAMNASQLGGSGFAGDGAATSWLRSTAPIEQGMDEIELRLVVYDAADGNVTTTILFDGLGWLGKPASVNTPPGP